MSGKKKYKGAIDDVCDTIWRQFVEDRELILRQYNELSVMLSGSIERYTTTGDTLAKTGDLLIKQTAQVVDFLKVLQKENEKDSSLSDDDYAKISDELKKDIQ